MLASAPYGAQVDEEMSWERIVLPSTATTMCGAPEHWSPRARTTTLWTPDVETVPDAVALLQIRRALPPLALESLKTCPEPAASVNDSPSMTESAAWAADSGHARVAVTTITSASECRASAIPMTPTG